MSRVSRYSYKFYIRENKETSDNEVCCEITNKNGGKILFVTSATGTGVTAFCIEISKLVQLEVEEFDNLCVAATQFRINGCQMIEGEL